MAEIRRAYARLEIKSFDDDKRTFEGIATTPSTDRMDDIVEPMGMKARLPIPMKWQHGRGFMGDDPVGQITSAKATKDGVYIKGYFAKLAEPAGLKDDLDRAWALVKAGLVNALSIGFNPLRWEDIKGSFGQRYTEWEFLELSPVTIPANPDAGIETFKAFDFGLLAASGEPSKTKSTSITPGASGTSRTGKSGSERSPMKKTYSEQIKDLEAQRAAKAARQEEIQTAATDAGRSKDESERQEFSDLTAEIKSIDEELVDVRMLEKRAVETAKVVDGTSRVKGVESRDTSRVITISRKEDPGIRFARMAMCIGAAKGHMTDAVAYAERFYSNDPLMPEIIRTAVAGGTTANGQAPLLQYTDLLTEFIDYLRPLTILGKFGGPIPGGNGANYPNLTRVPFNVRVGTQTAGGTGSWVGEGKPAPLTKGTFSTATLDFAKLAAISVLTKEEIRFTSISAETKVRNDLTNALVAKGDADFVDPSNTGTAGSKPASITNNVIAIPASGTTAVAFAVDLKALVSAMIAAGIQPSSIVLIMSQGIALSLSLMRTSLGVRNYPDLTMNGGFVEGIPVITSEAMTSVGSPSTPTVIAVNAKDVFLADDGVVNIEASDQASLEMSDAPSQDGTTGSGASMVSLWQTGMLGLKATREINWKLMRASSVQYISGAAYVPPQ